MARFKIMKGSCRIIGGIQRAHGGKVGYARKLVTAFICKRLNQKDPLGAVNLLGKLLTLAT
ncbi:hypothetical protein EVC45_43510 [Paraburkholderia sp. UYCP14C]|uniref:hypothetical protein n=1 Tax=Paraburkholderia sp. UYCP14C TaxID=2511130 RepID=UPI001021C346|nr:hypothetical protein [Paraburkholderia sp. UYCP14C]RZF23595.1 hypothetical protein EVC45_43510 [Paraburkholderia sp. UYCP14C]